LLFGAIPVLKYAGPRVAVTLRSGGRSLSYSKERHRARSTLVVVQVALAMLLLIGSGLMIRTFRTLRNVQPGFTDPEQVLTMRIYIPDNQVKDPVQAIRMQQNILDKIAAMPGVQSAALSSYLPWMATAGTIPSTPKTTSIPTRRSPPAPVPHGFARPAEDHGQHPGCRPRLHLDRCLRHAAGGHGFRKSGARIVAATRRPPSASESTRTPRESCAKSSAW
jgi:hypothetical protein